MLTNLSSSPRLSEVSDKKFAEALSLTILPSFLFPQILICSWTVFTIFAYLYVETMSTANTPNRDFGTPAVFFDSHPEEQESYLYSYWSSLKSQLKIAWTGDVPKFHEPGKLRIIFWTNANTQGIKDYELHQYQTVRDDWGKLLDMDDVRRAIVMGYSGQNPYILGNNGSNPWVDKFAREKRDPKKEEERRQRQEEMMAESKEGRKGELLDIQDIIARTDEAERKKREDEERKQLERTSENDRLLDV